MSFKYTNFVSCFNTGCTILLMTACAAQNPQSATNTVSAMNGSSAISGTITSQGAQCGTMQILLYSSMNNGMNGQYNNGMNGQYGNPNTMQYGNTGMNGMSGSPVYQTTVSTNGTGGTYQMAASPGTYTLVVNSQAGCTAQQMVTVTANQTQTVNLTVTNTGMNNGMNGQMTMNGYNTNYGYNSMYQYPGTGGVYMGKPNLYIDAPAGTAVQVNLEFQANSNILGAVPIHGKLGWKGVVNGEKIKVGNYSYDYLYYDAHIDAVQLQNAETFCSKSGADLISQMSEYLKAQGFTARELKDFEKENANQLPKGDELCAYPQSSDSIDRTAQLVVVPKPDSVTRVWFVVVASKVEARAVTKRFELNRKDLTRVALKTIKQKAIRKLASPSDGNGVHIREWGVGFVLQTPPSTVQVK